MQIQRFVLILIIITSLRRTRVLIRAGGVMVLMVLMVLMVTPTPTPNKVSIEIREHRFREHRHRIHPSSEDVNPRLRETKKATYRETYHESKVHMSTRNDMIRATKLLLLHPHHHPHHHHGQLDVMGVCDMCAREGGREGKSSKSGDWRGGGWEWERVSGRGGGLVVFGFVGDPSWDGTPHPSVFVFGFRVWFVVRRGFLNLGTWKWVLLGRRFCSGLGFLADRPAVQHLLMTA